MADAVTVIKVDVESYTAKARVRELKKQGICKNEICLLIS